MAYNQFDQAGIYIRLNSNHWLKTGIEVVDKHARLSCVVTNTYSDQSTQSWNSQRIIDGNDKEAIQVKCNIRVHCRGTNFVVESSRSEDGKDWEFVRIAHLSRNMMEINDPLVNEHASFEGEEPNNEGELWAGVFGCCPIEQQGNCYVEFHSFVVEKGSSFDHNANE